MHDPGTAYPYASEESVTSCLIKSARRGGIFSFLVTLPAGRGSAWVTLPAGRSSAWGRGSVWDHDGSGESFVCGGAFFARH